MFQRIYHPHYAHPDLPRWYLLVAGLCVLLYGFGGLGALVWNYLKLSGAERRRMRVLRVGNRCGLVARLAFSVGNLPGALHRLAPRVGPRRCAIQTRGSGDVCACAPVARLCPHARSGVRPAILTATALARTFWQLQRPNGPTRSFFVCSCVEVCQGNHNSQFRQKRWCAL